MFIAHLCKYSHVKVDELKQVRLPLAPALSLASWSCMQTENSYTQASGQDPLIRDSLRRRRPIRRVISRFATVNDHSHDLTSVKDFLT